MESRLKLIYDAASALFINKGYSRTQIKDIAKEIGLSTGMLYVYFTGKQEILNFLLKCTIDPDFIHQDFELPITNKLFDGLEKEIYARFEENSKSFARHLEQKDKSFERLISDAFDIISRYGTGCLLIEKNPQETGMLFEYYSNYRRKFFEQMLGYLKLYMHEGIIREVKHPHYVCQLIIENLAWWGMHVMNDAFELQKNIPVTTAKDVCMDNILHAYLKP
mgnify:CR=1 FL=1